MSNTQEHRNFVSEPMHNKPVTDLAGIGVAHGQRLARRGYAMVWSAFALNVLRHFSFQARHILSEFLAFDKEKEDFIEWLRNNCGASWMQANACYEISIQ